MGNAYIEDMTDEIQTFQEVLKNDSFWLLVACILVNRTNWNQAKPVLEKLRNKFGGPAHLSQSGWDGLISYMKPLGLWKMRSKSIIKLSEAYHRKPPVTAEDVLKLPGCGKYAADSWAIFVEGRTDVEPTDKVLIHYLKRKQDETR